MSASTHTWLAKTNNVCTLSLHSQLLNDLSLPCCGSVMANDDVASQCIAVAGAVVTVGTAEVPVSMGLVVLLEMVLHAKLLGTNSTAKALSGLA